MTSEEEKDEMFSAIKALQKQSTWHQLDVQKMIAFGILAFLAQFVFSQFAGDGEKISNILIAQESIKHDISALSKDVETLTKGTDKFYQSSVAIKDIEILQKQIDLLQEESRKNREVLALYTEKLRFLERTVGLEHSKTASSH